MADKATNKAIEAEVTNLDTKQEQEGAHLVRDDGYVPSPDTMAELFSPVPRVVGHPKWKGDQGTKTP